MPENVARVWNTGTPENPIFNFELPSGAKGEPGGWNMGSALGAADLNTITTPGLYYQSSPGNASNISLNYPPALAVGGASVRLSLKVANWGGSGAMIQEITTIGTSARPPVVYRRYAEGSNWQPWFTFAAQRVDQTAGRVIYAWDELNNREQMIYGDTGWRDISANLVPGNFVPHSSVPRCAIRREGNEVSLVMRLQASAELTALNQSRATLIPLIDLPTGFMEGPISYALTMTGVSHRNATVDVIGVGATHSSAQLRMAGTTTQPWRSEDVLGFNLAWKTNQPWPTSLPGTPTA